MIESDDEARHIAEAIIADVASGQVEPADMWGVIYGDDRHDAVWIGRFLSPLLANALRRWNGGDESPETARLVAFAANADDAQRASEEEAKIAKAQRQAERRAATLAAITPAPDITDRMIGVGLHGVPVPDDVAPDGDFLATRVAAPEPLMAFYIHHLRATGWTLDLDNSSPKADRWSPPQCYFSRPELPGRYVAILAGPSIDDSVVTRLHISEHDD